MPHLYHGSTTQHIKVLEPRQRYTPQGKIEYAAIYATPLTAYAASHSFPWSTDEGVKLDVVDGIVEMSIPTSTEVDGLWASRQEGVFPATIVSVLVIGICPVP